MGAASLYEERQKAGMRRQNKGRMRSQSNGRLGFVNLFIYEPLEGTKREGRGKGRRDGRRGRERERMEIQRRVDAHSKRWERKSEKQF